MKYNNPFSSPFCIFSSPQNVSSQHCSYSLPILIEHLNKLIHIYHASWLLVTSFIPGVSLKNTNFYLSVSMLGLAHFFAQFHASGPAPSPVFVSVWKNLAPKELCTLYPPSKKTNLFHRSWNRLKTSLVSLGATIVF